jgi:hypothetical protein
MGERTKFEFVIGDLVLFTGYRYTPDFVYTQNEMPYMGIVVDVGRSPAHEYMYSVYWFKTKRITATVAGHLELAYVI